MRIDYAFELGFLPKLVISTNGKPHPGDELVNSHKGESRVSFVVVKIVGDALDLKLPGGKQTMRMACNFLTRTQWARRFTYFG